MASTSELTQLLAPLDPAEFLSRYWEREPVHIRGTPAKFEHLFDRAAFDRAIADAEAQGISIRVSHDHVDRQEGVGIHFPTAPEQVALHYARGATICADPIDRGSPRLAAFALALKRTLHHAGPVCVKAYLSGDGFGFNAHFDRHVGTTIQLEGRKRWRFSRRPAVEFPHENGLLGRDGTPRYLHSLPGGLPAWARLESSDEPEWEEVVLEPGDVLCIPAGIWHSAKAIGHSLALNISFAPLDFLTLLSTALRQRLQGQVDWRRSTPAFLAGGPEAGPPRTLLDFFDQRLDELREELGRLSADLPELLEAWRLAVEGGARQEPPAFVLLRDLARRPAAADPPAEAARAPGERPEDLGLVGPMTSILMVRDLGAAIRWYEEVLGFRLRHRVDTLNWCELASPTGGGRTLALSEVPPATPAAAHERSAGLMLEVADLDHARARLEAKGVRFDGPTQVVTGIVKLAPLFDLDGNRLVLSQPLGR